MKNIYRSLILLIICASSPLAAQNFLYSIPRSGSHFFIYGMGFLTREPYTDASLFVEGKNADMTSPFSNPFELEFDSSQPPLLIRTHKADDVANLSTKGDKLILILRNPIEVLIAEKKMNNERVRKINQRDLNHFLAYLEYFESWSPENRLLLYYEDLVKNPRSVFDAALTFLGRDKQHLDVFIENIDHYRQVSKKKYSAHFPHNPAQSNNRLDHHQQDLSNPKQTNYYIHRYLSTRQPHLYHKYLAHYFK